MSAAAKPLVEILYFDGCPNHESAVALVEQVSRELGVEPELRLVNVPDEETAERLRFLGSPTIRVGGVDVDPHADTRSDYGLACRVFRTDAGAAGQPEERWVRDALERQVMGDGAEGALAAAAIPVWRRGAERARRLSDPERAFYRWILRRFAAAEPPTVEAAAQESTRLGVELDAAFATFAAEDLVHRDPASGAIAVAYPFSGRPRGHRVLIHDARWVEAMCAIDALGIAAMLKAPIEVVSHDPSSGTEIWVRVDPGDGAWWEPETAVVLAGTSCGDGPSFGVCCNVLNFFQTQASAERYLHEHPTVSGAPISIPDAVEAGQIVFGDLLEEA